MKNILVLVSAFLCAVGLRAQGMENPVTWEVEALRTSDSTAELHFRAKVDNPWVIYAAHQPGEEGPLPLIITLADKPGSGVSAREIVEVTPSKEKFDEMFATQVRYYQGEFHILLSLLLQGTVASVQGSAEYQACSATSCVPLSFDFDVPLPAGFATAALAAPTQQGGEDNSSLWLFFLLSLLAGFAGVLTPCVFPMLPMTVSFFMRGNLSRRGALAQLGVFAGSIVLIYTAIGAVAALTRSASFATLVSTHWLPNLIFFALFVLFAASFLGAFNLSLPQKWTNRIDAKADKGGFLGAFFVALTLCVVSFSCTGPFVGALLVAAAKGAVVKPLVGMLGFGVAFALPFTVLGVFPSVLKKLPKSGGWMNTLKVVFAFVMLAFAMKFLAVADSSLGFNLISRQLFLCVWIVCSLLLGMYFLGKIRFAHDQPSEKTSVAQFFMALVALVFALYLATGFWGNALHELSGFLPEASAATSQFDSPSQGEQPKAQPAFEDNLCGTPRFADNPSLSSPANLPAYFDLQEATACAQQQNKPLLIYFKGHYCANCKRMQGSVFVDRRVQELLHEQYVLAVLYIDDATELPASAWYTSSFDHKVKKTMGQQNLDYMITHFNVNSQPFFVALAADTATPPRTIGYTEDTEEFLAFLGTKKQ